MIILISSGVIEPVPVGQAAKDYLAKSVNPCLLKGLTELCKQKPIDPVVSNFKKKIIYLLRNFLLKILHFYIRVSGFSQVFFSPLFYLMQIQ